MSDTTAPAAIPKRNTASHPPVDVKSNKEKLSVGGVGRSPPAIQ
ncbi:hypothetical protein [Mycolicibacterium lutetiense]